jgi:hypothetical protein
MGFPALGALPGGGDVPGGADIPGAIIPPIGIPGGDDPGGGDVPAIAPAPPAMPGIPPGPAMLGIPPPGAPGIPPGPAIPPPGAPGIPPGPPAIPPGLGELLLGAGEDEAGGDSDAAGEVGTVGVGTDAVLELPPPQPAIPSKTTPAAAHKMSRRMHHLQAMKPVPALFSGNQNRTIRRDENHGRESAQIMPLPRAHVENQFVKKAQFLPSPIRLTLLENRRKAGQFGLRNKKDPSQS